MKKRKKIESRNDDRRIRKLHKNPFLLPREKNPDESKGEEHDDEIMNQVLAFVNNSEKKGHLDNIVDSVVCLVDFLQDASSSGSVKPRLAALSCEEIALLMLPWVVRSILSHCAPHPRGVSLEPSAPKTIAKSPSNPSIIWKALEICLKVLLKVDDKQSTSRLSVVLTQSTLFKLVPRMATFSVTFESLVKEDQPDQSKGKGKKSFCSNSDDGSDQWHASSSYQLILLNKLFRPTLDVAFKSLLLPIVFELKLEERCKRMKTPVKDQTVFTAQEKIERKILCSTIFLIRYLQQSRKGNPKTTFQLIADKSVLLALSRLYFYFQHARDGLILSEVCFFEEGNENHALIRDILYDALFHEDHHLDGFRSLLSTMNFPPDLESRTGSISTATQPALETAGAEATTAAKKKPSFRCYQEQLLSIIFEVFRTNSNVQDVHDTIWLLPILFRGFLEQTDSWDQKDTSTRRKRSSSKDGVYLLQFQMFSELVVPLRRLIGGKALQCGTKSTSVIALRALREMISLLLKHDSYLPSQNDRAGKHYSYLESIIVEVLEIKWIGDDLNAPGLMMDSIYTLSLLMQLNHLLIHERLVEVISFCLSSDDAKIHSQVATFFADIVDTYRQLRQQNYLFRSWLLVLDNLQASASSKQEISVLAAVLKDPSVSSTLAVAVAACPLLQAKAIFEELSTWLIQACKSQDNCGICFDVAVYLSVVTVRNVRVDNGTASEVAIICQHFSDNCIQAMIQNGNSDVESVMCSTYTTKGAMVLCGWLLHLHSRCAFWLGRKTELTVPSHLANVLDRAARIASESNGIVVVREEQTKTGYDVLDELVFLACHRLQTLHSHVHEQEHIELETGPTEKKSLLLVAKAAQLASFVALAAERHEHTSHQQRQTRWKCIAKHFASWVPYAKRIHVSWLLNWVFSVLTTNPFPTILPNESLAHPTGSHKFAEEDIEVAKGLICDASFYEHSIVAHQFVLVSLSCSAELVLSALAPCTTGNAFRDAKIRSQASPRIGNKAWQRSNPERIASFFVKEHLLPFESLSQDEKRSVVSMLVSAVDPIQIANGIAMPMTPLLDEAIDLVDSALRLDHVCRSLGNLDVSILSASMSFISALRFTVTKAITNFYGEDFSCVLGSGNTFYGILKGVLLSSIDLVITHGSTTSKEAKQFVFATGELSKQLIIHSFLVEGDLNLLKRNLRNCLDTIFVTESEIGENGLKFRVMSALARPLLKGLVTAFSQLDEVPDASFLSDIRESMWKIVKKTSSDENSDEDVETTEGHVAVDQLLLLGDLIHLSSLFYLDDDWSNVKTKNSIVKACIGRINNQNNTVSIFDEASFYVVACEARTSAPTSGMGLLIIDNILQARGDPHDLLDAAFCRLVVGSGLSPDELKSVLSRLLSIQEEDFTPRLLQLRLHLLELITKHLVKDDHQIQTISNFDEELFSFALKHLCDGNIGNGDENKDHWVKSVVAASSLLQNLTTRRDILSLREGDLARLLAHISDVLGPGGDGYPQIPDAIYNSCIRLVSCLLQRYSKLLYVCVPSVITVLHSLLRHAIYCDSFLPDHSSVTSVASKNRGNELTKLCEQLVPHRDVYKKHLVGLVLEFVYGLLQHEHHQTEEATFAEKKMHLLPALYCLLDNLTTYEMGQLNSFLINDTKARTLFLGAYQTYQKLHAYKGQ